MATAFVSRKAIDQWTPVHMILIGDPKELPNPFGLFMKNDAWWDEIAAEADHGNAGQGKIVRAIQEANRSTPLMIRLMWLSVLFSAIAGSPVVIGWFKPLFEHGR